MADIPLIQSITLDDILAMDADARVEVLEGVMVDMSQVGGTHHFIGGNTYRVLDHYVNEHDLGYVMMDGLLYLLDNSSSGLKGAQVPDVSFIRKSSIPQDWDMDLPFPGAPDLAIEVVSPHDDPELLQIRIQNYLKFGTEQVWVLYPKSRTLHQYRADQPDTVKIYDIDSTLSAESLFPGLAIKIADLFRLPTRDNA